MEMKISFNMDNAAFEGDPAHEVTAILTRILARVEDGMTTASISDSNGNKIGQWEIED